MILVVFVLLVILLIVFLRTDSSPILTFYSKFRPNKNKLRGKKVWIIGSSTGIGEELAYQLAELNCRLILTSTTESKLQEVKQKCIQRSNYNLKSEDVKVIAYDISDFKKNDIAFKKIIDEFGDLDILVCNAARILKTKILEDNFEEVKKLFEINLFSHIYITKLVVNFWMKNKLKNQKLNKRIFATSSLAAYSMLSSLYAYSGTKKAFNYFFQDLAMQYQSKGISVTLACPGVIDTSLFDNNKTNGQKLRFKNHRRMNVSRCCELMIIAMSNRIHEIWISNQPALLGAYFSEPFMFYIHSIIRIFNLTKLTEKYITD